MNKRDSFGQTIPVCAPHALTSGLGVYAFAGKPNPCNGGRLSRKTILQLIACLILLAISSIAERAVEAQNGPEYSSRNAAKQKESSKPGASLKSSTWNPLTDKWHESTLKRASKEVGERPNVKTTRSVNEIPSQEPAWQIRTLTQGERRSSDGKDTDESVVINGITFAQDSTGWVVGDRGILAKSEDRGQTWTRVSLPPSINLSEIRFHEKYGWAVGNDKGGGVVMTTEDSGSTWRAAKNFTDFPHSALHDVWFTSKQHGWVIGEMEQDGSTHGIILVTDDGGSNWKPQYVSGDESSGIYALKFVNGKRGWAVGQSIVLHTEDGGLHWREQYRQDGEYFFAVDFLDSRVGWVAGARGKLLNTTNGGETWSPVELPADHKAFWISSVRFLTAERGWLAGDNGIILGTSNGGKTWHLESVGSSDFLRSLAVTQGRIFAAGNNGIILQRQLESDMGDSRYPRH